MIVATAGHIDHGKTLLVKCLTGTDTDRLPEEKARGISIDLGFAYLPTPDGRLIGFVDVPGHERFIRNMLAGVCAIDYALVVVAADDGVMPQTLEHLSILRLLQVRRGAVVISKIDRVDESRLRAVITEVALLLSGTLHDDFPVISSSARTGAGIPELRSLLISEAIKEREIDANAHHFRYAVDRAFSATGMGTVVTGTVFGGTVRPNDKLVISGNAAEVRVRGIQIHGKAVTEASAGQRCALNLSGRGDIGVSRGDWVLHRAIYAPSLRLDVQVSMLPGETKLLKHWTPVHLHIGSAEFVAHVAIPGGRSIEPGSSGIAQLVLNEPACALRQDRFILRDQSASRTVGGGVVLDPIAEPIRRRDSSYAPRLAALKHGNPEVALAEWLNVADDGVDLDRFEMISNLTPDAAAKTCAAVEMIQIGSASRVAISSARYEALRQALMACLARFHIEHPDSAGQKTEQLRISLAPGMNPDAFASVLRGLAESGAIDVDGAVARLHDHQILHRPDDEALWRTVEPALEAAGFMPPTVRHLAAQLELNEEQLSKFLFRKAAIGVVVRVADDRFYTRATIARMAAIARSTARATADGSFTAAQYRDVTGASRRAVIKVLERFDALGITQRVGDSRRLGRDFVPIFGSVPAPVANQSAASPDSP